MRAQEVQIGDVLWAAGKGDALIQPHRCHFAAKLCCAKKCIDSEHQAWPHQYRSQLQHLCKELKAHLLQIGCMPPPGLAT